MREREKCSTPLKNFTFIEKLRPDIRNNSETLPSRRAAHIKRSRDTKKRHPQRQYTGQLPKRPHRGHNTVNKNSAKLRQHPREDIHIHSVEQDQPQGMKN